MDPNSSVHGQSQRAKTHQEKRAKNSIRIATAAIDSGILMQRSLSHLSKSFREMPSYTKPTYFMIHRGPWVWVFFSSALLLLFRRSSIPHHFQAPWKAMMQLIPTIWAQNLCLTQNAGSFSLFLSSDSSYSHNKPYWAVAKDQDTSGTGTRKKPSRISKGKGKVIYGAAPRIALRCFTPILNTNYIHLFALQEWDQWEALGWTVCPPRWLLTIQNTWS